MEERSIMDEKVVDDSAPVITDINPEQEKHKKKKPLFIAGIIFAILIVIGGGVGAFAFFLWKNSPDNIALDIFSNLMKEKNVTTTGKIKLTNNNSSYGDVEVSLKSVVNSDVNASLSADITFNTDKDHHIGLDGIYLSNGDLYFKLEDKSDAQNPVFELEDILSNASSMDSSTSAALISAGGTFDMSNLYGIWWKVSIPEIAEVMSGYFGPAISDAADSFYSCATDAVKEIYQNGNDKVELYKKNNFLSLKEKSKNVYDASIDRNKFASFINGMNETSGMKELNGCLSDLGALSGTISANVVDKENIAEKIPNTFIISTNDQNQLIKIALQSDNDDFRMDIDLSFEYNGYTNISAPSESTSVADSVAGVLPSFFGGGALIRDCDSEDDEDNEKCTSVDYSSLLEQSNSL